MKNGSLLKVASAVLVSLVAVTVGSAAWAQSAPSIDKFAYAFGGAEYNCTLEARVWVDTDKDGIADTLVCPDGTKEATVKVGDSNSYEVHVTASNPNDYAIDVKVQGGLAAGKNTSYSVPSVDCGSAVIEKSNARTSGGNTGNVVTWTLKLAAAGEVGNSCSLAVTVSKKFTSAGEQAVTSSWSAVNLTDSTALNVIKSAYTGSLAVNVQ